MDETLEINQLDSEEGLFDDYVPEDTTESAEQVEEPTEESTEESTTETEETIEVPENADNSFLHVKFNGEERDLTEEEARVLAQKGMNYDRFYEPIERLARLNNMTVGEYVNQLNDTQVQYEVSKEMEALKEDPKYANIDDSVLEEIAQSRVNQNMGERDRSYQAQAQEQADAQQAQAQREIDKFMEEYPEYKNKGPEALDPKVFEFVKQGYTLLEAYNKFQRETSNKIQAEAKAKASKLNEDNKKKSLGNTSNAGEVEKDDFLSGFLE